MNNATSQIHTGRMRFGVEMLNGYVRIHTTQFAQGRIPG